MEDIENVADDDAGHREQSRSLDRALVFPKHKPARKSGAKTNASASDDEAEPSSMLRSPPSLVPGTQKIWLKTYGCSHNVSDSEYMEGILSNYGFHMTEDPNDADLWLVNSCTVKDPSQAAFMHVVHKAQEQGRPIVVAGCVPQADRSVVGLEGVSVVGISQIDRVVEVVEQTLQGNAVRLLSKKELPRLDLPKIRKNPLVEIVPLSTGCLGSCTYCKTKHARGNLGSYALEAIVDRVRQVAIEEHVAEIWLSSEDTGAYGIDLDTNIAELLKAIIAVLPPNGPMLRVGMTNPPYMLEHLDVIAEILNHPQVFAFLHVPVQAGSNRVLEAMNREYTVEEFRRVVDTLAIKVPDVTIATDIICGFPNETEDDFDKTLALMEDYKLAIVNISQFYPRPGTPAAKMKRIATNIVKDRSRRLTRLFEGFTPYLQYPGRTVRVWFNTEVADDGTHSVGHTKAYVKVLVPFDSTLPGTSYMVEIHACQRFHIEGIIVGEMLSDCKASFKRTSADTPVELMETTVLDGDVSCGCSDSVDILPCCGASTGSGCCSSEVIDVSCSNSNGLCCSHHDCSVEENFPSKRSISPSFVLSATVGLLFIGLSIFKRNS